MRDTAINGLTVDSRRVSEGDLFVALPGFNVDGRDYIHDAIERGAAAILTTPLGTNFSGIHRALTVVEDQNPRRLYASMAARFCGQQPEKVVAVTGTNGKTSVAEFARQLWENIGVEAGSVGTLGVCSSKVNLPGGLTTPDPVELYSALNALAANDVNHVAVEASSHGLDQYRLDGLNVDAAAFTNLTRDHLDYHRNEHAYFFAKARLFGEIMQPGATAVVNLDDPCGKTLDDIAWGRGLERISYGADRSANLQLLSAIPTSTGQKISVRYEAKQYDLELGLVGAFQASNVLAAAGLVMATGAEAGDVFGVFHQLRGVPGRMELVAENGGTGIFVDYAHTPDGLRTALSALRGHSPRAIHVVFGCGGDRDVGKRPQMGSIACELADHVYVTDDNPRSEDPAFIRDQVIEGCQLARNVPDRADAIAMAIENAGPEDMVLIAGKGHETGQIVGNEVIPFSDVEAVKAALGSPDDQVKDSSGRGA